jgi:hypothetical protein
MRGQKKWYFKRGSKQDGPYTNREIRTLVRGGEVLADDLLWKEGMSKWIPAGDFPKLFRVLTPRKKPLPVRLLGITAFTALCSLIFSPFGDLYHLATPSWCKAACLTISGGCGLAAILAVVFAFVGREPNPTKVPVGQRHIRPVAGVNEVNTGHSDVAGESRDDEALPWDGNDVAAGAQKRRSKDTEEASKPYFPAWRYALLAALCGVMAVANQLRPRAPKSSSANYAIRLVQGNLAYEDGALLKGHPIMLKFVDPESEGKAALNTDVGLAKVNPQTGDFTAEICVAKTSDMQSSLRKVVVLALDGRQLEGGILAAMYADAEATPLVVDTKKVPLTIRLKRP